MVGVSLVYMDTQTQGVSQDPQIVQDGLDILGVSHGGHPRIVYPWCTRILRHRG